MVDRFNAHKHCHIHNCPVMLSDTFNVDVCVVTQVNAQFPALMTSIFFSFVYSWAGESGSKKKRHVYRFRDLPGM